MNHNIIIHWASKETYQFFRATLTKIHAIKIYNICTQISFNNTPKIRISKNTRFSRVNAVKSLKVYFSKIAETALSELHGGGLFRTFNSYSFNFNGGLRKCRTGYCLLRTPSPERQAVSVIFEIWPLAISSHLSPLWLKYTFVFQMCLWRINLPNLCPNMNHFDEVDFSECHSEEVISSFDAQCIEGEPSKLKI